MVEIRHPQFGTVEAEDVDFESPEEEWRNYELEDGTTLKVKTVVNKVFRIEDQYTDLGEPVYQISTQNLVRSVDVPDELMGEPDQTELPQQLLSQLQEGTQQERSNESEDTEEGDANEE